MIPMGETVKFFPYDIAYKVVEGRAHVHLYGRALDDGRRICVIDESFEPYFHVVPAKGHDVGSLKEKLAKLSIEENNEMFKVLRVEALKKIYKGSEIQVLNVVANIPSAVPKLRSIIRDWEMIESIHEYDILFARRYLIDKSITPMALCEAEGDVILAKSRVKTLKA